MDYETPAHANTRETKLLRKFKLSIPASTTTLEIPRPRLIAQPNDVGSEIEKVASKHGMPWTTSIDPTYQRDSLFYMPFWEWQIDFMKKHLTNLRVVDVTSRRSGRDLSFVENSERKIRLHTLQLASDEYKSIRLTVLDAGARTQVFTSLWYPDPSYNLPVLGVDLLQFQEKKHLCIVDFQPIQETEAEHDLMYEHLLEPIRNQYSSLQGKMTKRFYQEDAFFSKQMLLGRCTVGSPEEGTDNVATSQDAHDMVFRDLFPAYQSYVKTHLNLIRQQQRESPSGAPRPQVLERHAAYDNYSAARDPAHGLLAAHFGQEFADDYVYDILFPLSDRPAGEN